MLKTELDDDDVEMVRVTPQLTELEMEVFLFPISECPFFELDLCFEGNLRNLLIIFL